MATGRTLQIKTPRVFLPFMKPSRYKGAYGGRGSGKSHIFAEMLIERFVLEPTTRAVCIREIQKSLEQSVKRLLEDKIKEWGLEYRFRILNNEILTPEGGVIIFVGMQNYNADTIKSLEGYDIAWVEEAQSLSERSLTLLRPTIRKEGSEIWFSWNPREKTDPVDALLRGPVLPPDSIVVGSTYADNPWFPDVLRTEMEWDRTRDQDKFAHVWLGGYEQHSNARVFKNFRVEEFETPSDAVLFYGGDWGFSVDPSVLVRLFFRDAKTLCIDYEAYQIGCEIDHLPALFSKVPDSTKWPIRADSARPETISYLKRHGFPLMEPATKGPNSVKEGVIFLQSYDIVIHPRCRHAIDEFTLYSYVVERLTGIVTNVLEDKKNHVIDSVRYAVENYRKGLRRTRELVWG